MNLFSIILFSTLNWSTPDSVSIVLTPTVENVDTNFLATESILFIADVYADEEKSSLFMPDSVIQESVIHESFLVKDKLIDTLIFNGTALLGTPYRYAGNSKKGIDCSGLIHYMFESMGTEIARNSRDLSKLGIKVDMDEVAKGDLVFFKGRNSKSKNVGHVAIVVEGSGDEMLFLHASSSRGVVIDKISDATYFKKRLLFAKRLELEEMMLNIN
ncbi:C40 family peptidase [Brumimicrobium oceani]|uniref:NlpC/P60 domain-containing protein n=1 Tax=Brumimicrobium oceani TaxID=2100725 RepID=A0A2U2XFK5_9FLAO|nr:C40 family peptidase [Brumimicrobium oceani]PWH86574.1 hypothetical protein DIT68_04890 [Brumimicrobium oceani]